LDEYIAEPGRPTGEGALIAWAALERAAQGCKSGEFTGTVTGPISKEWMVRIGYPYPGHTEFFAARWGGEPVMGFCGGKLRVVLATWHVPLHQVSRLLGPHMLERTVRAADELARVFGTSPAGVPGSKREWAEAGAALASRRIGVCGLNPHAGEGGLLGYEERDLIDPALEHLKQEFPGLSRCQPSDTIFARALRGEFDVIVAMYHDQGLAPLKTIDFDESVNVTLGLPHVRTSPDHGTAFGIAGKGVARPTSFANSVDVARRLIAARKQ
jgi:4-hydroxythreonine-4-phosphate dehydrogenase